MFDLYSPLPALALHFVTACLCVFFAFVSLVGRWCTEFRHEQRVGLPITWPGPSRNNFIRYQPKKIKKK